MTRPTLFVSRIKPLTSKLLSRLPQHLPSDFDDEKRTIITAASRHSMASPERLGAVVDAVRYIDTWRIPGAVVECGVWRGGSMMAAALAHTSRTRELFLYDTFSGMPPPSYRDRDGWGRRADELLASEGSRDSSIKAFAPLDTVKANIASTGYPQALVRFVAGRVEDTVPEEVPASIALLRLDTDWYESTRHELEHLVPLMAPRAVLIIDDYGHWTGARDAVDEWLRSSSKPIFLARTDYTGRIAVVP